MDKKYQVIFAAGAIVVGIVILLVFAQSRRQTPPAQEKTSSLVESQKDLKPIPTVGPSVKVTLESVQKGKEAKLVVDGVPGGTDSIEYELTYSTREQESEGIFSTARPAKGESVFPTKFERQVTFGTCSRNVCRYHVITSDITIRLKFEGTYGAALFERSFPNENL